MDEFPTTEDKNKVNAMLANKDDGACPDDGCSGGVTNGWCSHCNDEWAWKQHENNLEWEENEKST